MSTPQSYKAKKESYRRECIEAFYFYLSMDRGESSLNDLNKGFKIYTDAREKYISFCRGNSYTPLKEVKAYGPYNA